MRWSKGRREEVASAQVEARGGSEHRQVSFNSNPIVANAPATPCRAANDVPSSAPGAVLDSKGRAASPVPGLADTLGRQSAPWIDLLTAVVRLTLNRKLFRRPPATNAMRHSSSASDPLLPWMAAVLAAGYVLFFWSDPIGEHVWSPWART